MLISLLRQSIINTLAYFDLADYPLTKEELFSWLWQPPDFVKAPPGKSASGYPDFLNAIANLNLDSKLSYIFLRRTLIFL